MFCLDSVHIKDSTSLALHFKFAIWLPWPTQWVPLFFRWYNRCRFHYDIEFITLRVYVLNLSSMLYKAWCIVSQLRVHDCLSCLWAFFHCLEFLSSVCFSVTGTVIDILFANWLPWLFLFWRATVFIITLLLPLTKKLFYKHSFSALDLPGGFPGRIKKSLLRLAILLFFVISFI